jgi:2-dehydro-3-deoxygluconokinase
VGDDLTGEFVLSALQAAGVNVEFAQRVENARTGLMLKVPTSTGMVVEYYRKDSAATMMSLSTVTNLHSHNAAVIHLTGITPALSPSCMHLCEEILIRNEKRSIISFDLNWRPSLWREDASEILRRMAAKADVVFVGLDEANELWGTESPESVREFLPEPDVLIVKNGGHQAISFSDEGVCRSDAFEVQVVDVVGAGDAFAAGWLSGMLRGFSQSDRLKFGHSVASEVLKSPTDTTETENLKWILDSLPSSDQLPHIES